MKITKTSILTAMLGSALAGASASAAQMLFTDPAAFSAGLLETHVESFESMGSGSVGSLGFGGAITAPVTSSATENAILAGADGLGAVSMGPGQFWKLKGGATTINLGSAWDGFGFWYSDLEAATLIITLPELSFSAQLDDNNPNVNHFFGVRSDTPFSRVTIAWSVVSGDGVGFDDVIVGRVVPAPGSGALAALSFVCVAGVRGRGRKGNAAAA
jgi:hypothetical protein